MSLLFSSKHERVVSVWVVGKKKKTGSIANLVVNDDIATMVISPQTEQNVILVSTVTTRGKVSIFKICSKSVSGTVQPIHKIS